MRKFIFIILVLVGCTTQSRAPSAVPCPLCDSDPPECRPTRALQAVLNKVYKNGVVDPPILAKDILDGRRGEGRYSNPVVNLVPVENVRDVTITSGRQKIPLRIYMPKFERRGPTVLFVHGGGWVKGSISEYDTITREIANSLKAVVVSVGYRRAPESVFPAALDDTLAALRWVSDHLEQLGDDTDRLVLIGDSAGGNLAAVAALKSQVPIAAQLLIYPVTDLSRDDYPSQKKYGRGYFLTASGVNSFRRFYAPNPADWKSPEASPVLASEADLKHAPPTLLLVAGCDPLSDESLAYGRKLQAAGVPVYFQWEAGMTHGFVSEINHPANPAFAAEAEAIFEKALAQLKAMLNSGT